MYQIVSHDVVLQGMPGVDDAIRRSANKDDGPMRRDGGSLARGSNWEIEHVIQRGKCLMDRERLLDMES